MIKLILNPDKQPDVKIYNKPVVIIGSDASGNADLPLQDEGLSPSHVKIQELNGSFIIINQANDPFVTVNGMPFGKKTLKNNDKIQIGKTVVQFYGEHAIIPGHAMVPTDKLDDIIEDALTAQRIAVISATSKKTSGSEQSVEEEEWPIEGIDNADLQDLIRQVEELEANRFEEEMKPPSSSADLSPTQKSSQHHTELVYPKNKGSLKDAYLSEFDDENQGWNKLYEKKEETPPDGWNWKFISTVLALFLLLFAIGSIFFYLRISAKNAHEELRAAESVADVAMALTFAQVHHIKPQNQNWSDADFLKNNLIAILSSDTPPLVNLDNHGQFGNSSYHLRIYTSNDLSQFLIIAQPSPSLLQWIFPKESIIVHSKAMELRKIHDLKTINRLLLNPTSFDGINAAELGQLVKQGQVISLEALHAENPKGDFKPPAALAHLRPGAENLIYNAPRYYHFGEGFLKKAQSLANNYENSEFELTFFQEELQDLSKYTHIVLYTSYGIQWARQAQKQLNVFLPQNKFLIAHLKLTPKGLIANSQLLMDEGAAEIAMEEPSFASPSLPHHSPENSSTSELKEPPATPDIDKLHPLYTKLKALATDYKNGFQPIEDQFRDLLKNNDLDENIALLERLHKILLKSEKSMQNDTEKLKKNQAASNFIEKLQKILKDYREFSQREDEILRREILQLYQNHPNIPVTQYEIYLKSTGFADYIQEHLKFNQNAGADLPSYVQIEDLMKKIRQAQDFDQLGQQVKDLTSLLNLGKIPDTQKLQGFQKNLRTLTLEKLNDFLFSGDKGLPQEAFIAENRILMANVLKDVGIVEPDEFDFYLNEFDLRLP